ncbi:MAG TPA: hypothetical protein VF730_15745, partial [Terracidiphilus sp.]
MVGKLVLTQIMLGAMTLAAQQAAPSQSGPAAGAPPQTNDQGPLKTPQNLSRDAVKLTEKINSSYYHPDNLNGLECDVTPDWPGFFNSTKMMVSQDQAQSMEAAKTHVRAVRDETPQITFDWTKGKIAGADKVEAMLRQTINQFYQVYWNMFASPAVKYAAVISKIEPQPDGTITVYESDPNAYVIMTVAKDGTPTHYTMESPALTGIVDAQYTRSPHPRNGDRRRISQVEVSERSGTASMNVRVGVDYQPLKDYFVPKNVSFTQVGAYTLTLEFSGCAAETAM